MKNKALHFMAAAVLSSALLMTGCGSHSGDTNSSTKQTQDQTQRGAGQDSAQTSAAEDQNQASEPGYADTGNTSGSGDKSGNRGSAAAGNTGTGYRE